MSCSSTLTSISRLLTTQIVEGVEYEVEGCEMPLYYGELKSGLCWMPDLAPPHTSNGRVNNATHSAFHLIAFGGGDDDELLRGLRSVSLAMSVGEAEPSVRVSNVGGGFHSGEERVEREGSRFVGLRGLIDRAMAIVGAAKVVSDTAPLLPLERSIVPGGGLPSRLLLRGQRERFKHSYNFCAVTPRKGTMVVFPGYVPHCVVASEILEEPRVSIACNIKEGVDGDYSVTGWCNVYTSSSHYNVLHDHGDATWACVLYC